MRFLIQCLLGLSLTIGGVALLPGCSKDEPTNPNLKIPDVPAGGSSVKNPPMKVYGKKEK
jgi:hypothetical protein